MPRYDEKIITFNRSIIRETSGRKIVRTSEFLRLTALNHDSPLEKANRWGRMYARTFRDASTYEGKDKLWLQFNPNGGL